MKKKTASYLLIAAATVFNIFTFFAVFAALMFIFFLFSFKLLVDESLSMFASPLLVVVFISSIGITFFIYRSVLSFFLNKADPENIRFEQVFIPRKKNSGGGQKTQFNLLNFFKFRK